MSTYTKLFDKYELTLKTSLSSDKKLTVNLYVGFKQSGTVNLGKGYFYIGESSYQAYSGGEIFYFSQGHQEKIGPYTLNVSGYAGQKIMVKGSIQIDGQTYIVSGQENIPSGGGSSTTSTAATFELKSSSYELNSNPHVSITSGSNNYGCTYQFICTYTYGNNKTTTTSFTKVSGGNYSDKVLAAVPWENYPGTSNTTCTVTLNTLNSSGGKIGSCKRTFTVLAPTPASIYYKNTSNTYSIGDRIPLTISPGKSKRPVYYKITYGSGVNSWSETVSDSAVFNSGTGSIKIPAVAIKDKASSPSYTITITTMNGDIKIGNYTTISKFTVNMPEVNPKITLGGNGDWETNKTYKINLEGLISSYTYKLEYKYDNENYNVLKDNIVSTTTSINFTPTKKGTIYIRLSVINGNVVYKILNPISKTVKMSADDLLDYKISNIELSFTRDTNGNPYYNKYYRSNIGVSSLYLKIKITKGAKAVITKITLTSADPNKIGFQNSSTLETTQYIKLSVKANDANGTKITVIGATAYGEYKKEITIPNDIIFKSYKDIKITDINDDDQGNITFTLKGTAEEAITYSSNIDSISGSVTANNFSNGQITITKFITNYDSSKKYLITITASQTLNGNEYTGTSEQYSIEGEIRPFNINFNKKMITIGGLAQRTSTANNNGWSFEIVGDLYINGKKVTIDSNGFLKAT